MTQLKKGDPCRVRLHTGEVVEAVYDRANSEGFKHHYLRYKDDQLIAVSRKLINRWECRFVGNPCALVPIGDSK